MERIVEWNVAEVDGMTVLYKQRNDFGRDFLPSTSVAWMERSSEWQQGGISNGEMITMRIAFKPTSTIVRKQHTVTRDRHETELIARGRRDPCVVPRAVPMVEAMVALVILDQLMVRYAQCQLLPINPCLQEPVEAPKLEIVEELLIATVADADVSVRQSVFLSLHGNGGFDEFLAQADSLSAIFVALNDEDFDVQEFAILVAGRLSEKNPAYVLPALRRHLIQLLMHLEQRSQLFSCYLSSADSKCREESDKLLGCLIRNLMLH
ncbi:uncharacterized protein LOC131223716 isoform X1 [Magnolia sinica]|uniref:uncharacterized protein LOC131223716 isoform X1 n=2 Tax=Magnolia sinica TaxID=86752 RepID=UPI00265A126A|nr:uncharacterized protein LOC131223716 isoform X1 [Magnolia sinica]